MPNEKDVRASERQGGEEELAKLKTELADANLMIGVLRTDLSAMRRGRAARLNSEADGLENGVRSAGAVLTEPAEIWVVVDKEGPVASFFARATAQLIASERREPAIVVRYVPAPSADDTELAASWRKRAEVLREEGGSGESVEAHMADVYERCASELSTDAPCDAEFGVHPGDSAALLRLRESIDAADLWPSDQARDDGAYEAAVAFMASRASADAAMARWAVEVLDAWARKVNGWWLCQHRGTSNEVAVCDLEDQTDEPRRRFEADTDDAARIAAAKTLREADPSLPAPPGGAK